MKPHTQPANEPRRIDDDHVYQILANSRRRAVLDILHAHGPMTKGELAERIAEREGNEPTGQSRKRVVVSLHQCHLPMLEDYDVLRDMKNDTYRLGPNAEPLLKQLEYSPELGGIRERVGRAVRVATGSL